MRTEQAIDSERAARGAGLPRRPGRNFAITGMTCANCARHVTEAIQSVPGVSSATVRLEANRASVRWAAGAEHRCPCHNPRRRGGGLRRERG